MRQVKLTVTHSECRCGYHKEGDAFLVGDLCPPLCHELWHTVYPSVYALLNGAELDCGAERAPQFDAKCPDGGRVCVHGELVTRQGDGPMERLLGAPFHSLSRAVDMLCLNLGPEVDWTSSRGESRRMPAYSIHLQTPWRFVRGDNVLLASRDIYEPFAPDAVGGDWAYDPVGRSAEEGSLCDALIPELSRLMAGSAVTACRVSPPGDLELDFSNGIRFQSFTPDSRKCEAWRLVDYRTGEHLVE